jgi:hypothetical protein
MVQSAMNIMQAKVAVNVISAALTGAVNTICGCDTPEQGNGGSGARGLTNKEAKEAAKELGYDQEVKDPGFDSHGNKVFTNGKTLITADRDSHSGGVWKVFDSSGNRLGTFDANLNRIGN